MHSPCPLTVTLREELDRLGTVGFVVPASSLHGHLHIEDYQDVYPRACIYAAPGLKRRRPDVHFAGTLGGEPEPGWRDDTDQATFDGVRRLIEIEFLHRASRTLITGDVCFNIGAKWPLLTRLWAHGPRLVRAALTDCTPPGRRSVSEAPKRRRAPRPRPADSPTTRAW